MSLILEFIWGRTRRGDLIKVLDAALVKKRRKKLQKKVDKMIDKETFDESTRNLYIELMKDETLIKDTEQQLDLKIRIKK
jgi:hypothetical protein